MNDTLNKYTFTLKTWEGESVEATYRLPPLRKLPEYLDKVQIGQEAECAAFILSVKVEEMDRYTDDCIYELLDKVAEQLNPRVTGWIERSVGKVKKAKEDMEAAVSQQKNPGTDSSQTSLPKQDGPTKDVSISPSHK